MPDVHPPPALVLVVSQELRALVLGDLLQVRAVLGDDDSASA
eukprot:CAMPEP_0170188224 /NCGR_PEP_ID=MMETSP0040_2-20121228/43820_1 /TAXON_ID=641309 /ORGANISM="Lotharella oceanica, Strain CCMP622" /LENGTH=41 /DNA_ID= /DNA_START= /DNA_END= /DNA_ORIENTATION=